MELPFIAATFLFANFFQLPVAICSCKSAGEVSIKNCGSEFVL